MKTKDQDDMKELSNHAQEEKQITRKKALQKLGTYGKYAALTALGTYLILNPKKAQASSPEAPGNGF